MKRDLQKLAKEFDTMLTAGSAADFYYSDLEQLCGMDLYSAVTTALKAGYVLGYKRAQRRKATTRSRKTA